MQKIRWGGIFLKGGGEIHNSQQVATSTAMRYDIYEQLQLLSLDCQLRKIFTAQHQRAAGQIEN